MSMKSTKKKSKVTKNLKFKIKYDSKNSINLKIENLYKNKVLLNKILFKPSFSSQVNEFDLEPEPTIIILKPNFLDAFDKFFILL